MRDEPYRSPFSYDPGGPIYVSPKAKCVPVPQPITKAKATRHEFTPPPVAQKTQQLGVTLELTLEQAQVLKDIVGHAVTGHDLYSRRGLTSQIYHALDDAGIQGNGRDDMRGGVYFQSTGAR